MSKFREFLLNAKELAETKLIEGQTHEAKSKDDYIINAEEGLVVAFRLNFESKSKISLTKVISGKILENDPEKEAYIVETRNGLKYCVPYSQVVWVKTGGRWPKGVYDEMKQGPVVIEKDQSDEFGELEL